MSSVLGTLFRISTFGESHGGAVGVVLDGCPARLPLSADDIQPQLDRRRPGQSRITTPRQEADRVSIVSGLFEGRTLGTPIAMWVANEDARPGAYEEMKEIYRPSHADFSYDAKFGFRSWQGGGRSSARETIGRVAAGAIAEKILRLAEGIEIVAYVRRVGDVEAELLDPLREVTAATPRRARGAKAAKPSARKRGREGRPSAAVDPLALTRKDVDRTIVRCPDLGAAERMIERIEQARRDGDSLGGIVECVIRGVPAGLGEPVFDRVEADLGKAMLSLPATKGFEIGSGFEGARLSGSTHNDAYVAKTGRIGTRTNRSGGVQGGITDGEPIVLRVAFKPTATIRKPQETVDQRGRMRVLEARGRHDPCVLPRAIPMVEAMAALVLVDHWLRQLALAEASSRFARRPSR